MSAHDPAAPADYGRCIADPATVHAICEDYRAAATIDLEHDAVDEGRLLQQPLLLWGKRGLVERMFDPLKVWTGYAEHVEGRSLDAEHFLADERPDEVATELKTFFAG